MIKLNHQQEHIDYTTVDRLWINLASGQYPTLNESALLDLRITASTDWLWDTMVSGNPTLVKLFDQYVMMKKLTQ